AVHGTEPDADPPAPDREWRPDAEPSSFELLTRAAYNNATRPWRFARLMQRMTPGGERFGPPGRGVGGDAPTSPAPRTRFSGVPPPDREGRRDAEPSSFELLTGAAYNTATRRWRFARLMQRMTPGGERFGPPGRGVGGDAPTSPAPRTRFSGVLSGHKVIDAR